MNDIEVDNDDERNNTSKTQHVKELLNDKPSQKTPSYLDAEEYGVGEPVLAVRVQDTWTFSQLHVAQRDNYSSSDTRVLHISLQTVRS